MNFVYHSFEGRFSDSPRPIYAALRDRVPEARHVWLADPLHAAWFPPGVETVPWGTPEGRAALEAADVLVANTHTDVHWDKPAGTVYLQTWHGTPLKRIHWDVLWAPEGRLERLQRDVDRWDALLAPNRASVASLRQAFRFDRDVLETGYPRNDVLNAPERDAIRARVRDELGIADGVTAVLYAPTWRDDVVFAGGDGAIELQLDAEAVADALGPGHCLLLRLHYMLTGRLRATEHPQIRDVSFYADISDLYLAADVLITDYSSAMFDFAITGRPLLFFVYDLAEYRDRLRGFYFDFAPGAPGPLLETTAEVIDALGNLDVVKAAYTGRYAAFRERFCHLEDGHATERVVGWLLERTSAAPAASKGGGAS
jgi:CDP-glycerol glycerophosphotransferase